MLCFMETFLVFYVKHKGIKCFMDSSSTFIILWPLNRICLLTSTRYEVIKKPEKSLCYSGTKFLFLSVSVFVIENE